MPKPKTRRSRRRRYAWSLHFPPDQRPASCLTGQAAEGLRYAQELAWNVRERAQAARRGDTVEKLTVRDLADIDGTSTTAVYAALKEARIALFGEDLSDAGIYYRLRRARQPAPPDNRLCQVQRCDQPLPPKATVRRRYCDFHATGVSRVRRHRASKQPAGASAKTHDPNAPVRVYRRGRTAAQSAAPKTPAPPWLTEEFAAKLSAKLSLTDPTAAS